MSCASVDSPPASAVNRSARQSHSMRGPLTASSSPSVTRKCVAFASLSAIGRYIASFVMDGVSMYAPYVTEICAMSP